jgi:hypothetical protein
VSAPRAVRIPREQPPIARPATGARSLPATVRPNVGGGRRAIRIASVYAGSILALTVILAVFDLTSTNANRPVVQAGLELFLGVAAVLAVGSALYALSPAPRSMVVRADGAVVTGRWGRRRSFGPLGSFQVRVLRHIPAGPLAPQPVELVQVLDLEGRSVTYEVEAGFFEAVPGLG